MDGSDEDEGEGHGGAWSGPNDGMRDDPDRNPVDLRFRAGNLVMYKSKNGWFEGEVVKVSQRLIIGAHQQYIPYIVWPHRDGADGTEWVEEDTDDFVKPRMEDRTPDPTKFNPLLVVPDDPYHYLYTGETKYDSKTEEGVEMADMFKGHDFVESAKTNPDGSVSIQSKDGRRMTSVVMQIPEEPVCGVDGVTAVMYATKHLSIRYPLDSSPTYHENTLETFKSHVPKEKTLAILERKAKTSSRKMLQLGDCLMAGMKNWPRDPHRACNLFRAAAWGCTEEEEPNRVGIPNGIPEAMIASASIVISFMEHSLGYGNDQHCPPREWIEHGLESADGMAKLHHIFFWISNALSLHSHVTPLTLILADIIHDMNFLNDQRLTGGDGEQLKFMCQRLLRAKECRNKEMEIKEMQERGAFPRGPPSNTVIDMFKPKLLEIFQNLPIANDTMHIEFKQVPRPPFPMVAISLIPSKCKIQNIVMLPESLQMAPFSIETFEYIWPRIAFDIHLGRLGTDIRVRPKGFSVPDTHGNRAFSSFLKDMMKDSDTPVQLVSHADTLKISKKSLTTLGQLVSEMVAIFVDTPGVLVDSDSANDIVARAQEDFFDRIIAQQMSGNDDEDDGSHLNDAQEMKQRGNQQFQDRNNNAAVKCYSIALGHLRRIIDHDEIAHRLLGTLLSNRAACFLNLLDDQHSLEFRKILARNAINDCTNALGSSWASTSLPPSILEKLKFRRDKASASYDSLATEYGSIAGIFFPDNANGEIRKEQQQTTSNGLNDGNGQTRMASESPRNLEMQDNVGAIDALLEYGEILFKHGLAKNAKEGCPICLRQFGGELSKSYAVVLPCGEHAICANCLCNLKIQADKAKQPAECPLCRHAFENDFVESIPSQMIEKDQEIANLILKLPTMELDNKIALTKRLLWTHRFEQPAVVDALESLIDSEVSSTFFRNVGDLTHEQKNIIYCQARLPVEKLENNFKTLMHDLSGTSDAKDSEKLCRDLRRIRKELAAAKEKARDDIYNQMNSAGMMGAQQDRSDGCFVRVDYHGLHVNEMRMKFKEHVLPILPVVRKVMIITGYGSHSSGKEAKLKKALFRLVGQYSSSLYWQKLDQNPGALYVLWRAEK